MISKNIINAVLKVATIANKEKVIQELINHFSIVYDYNDNYKNHILEMLVDEKAIITKDDIDILYVEKNITNFIYGSKGYNIKDVEVKYVDNIECIVRFDYKFIEKTKEDNADTTYKDDTVNISYIDYPQLLKKS